MSTNDKNKIRDAYLMNFIKRIGHRFIVASDTYAKKDSLIGKSGEINEDVNKLIQELNLLVLERNIPYIRVTIKFLNEEISTIENDTRIIIEHPDNRNYKNEIIKRLEISKDKISHILDFLIATDYKTFTVSSLSCDAKLVLDDDLFENAIIDILLDICMFNSYSFLRKMNYNERKTFSHQKMQFCNEKRIKCFYDVGDKNVKYFSLAFAARGVNGKLNIQKYIKLWNEFISEYYGHEVHTELSIKEQLKNHIDFGELPQNCHERFKNKEKGVYLLLRTNKDRSQDILPQLFTLFGINKYRKGLIKIIPINKYNEVVPLLKHLDVSAFKVIKI